MDASAGINEQDAGLFSQDTPTMRLDMPRLILEMDGQKTPRTSVSTAHGLTSVPGAHQLVAGAGSRNAQRTEARIVVAGSRATADGARPRRASSPIRRARELEGHSSTIRGRRSCSSVIVRDGTVPRCRDRRENEYKRRLPASLTSVGWPGRIGDTRERLVRFDASRRRVTGRRLRDER